MQHTVAVAVNTRSAALHIYRSDIIIPFGLLSMLIQATVFA